MTVLKVSRRGQGNVGAPRSKCAYKDLRTPIYDQASVINACLTGRQTLNLILLIKQLLAT